MKRILKKIMKILPDKLYLKLKYFCSTKKILKLKNPKTFNEKIQWLKLYDKNDEYIKMVDKYEVKKYISERIGCELVIPTIGVWNRFEDIDFDLLPNKFVLKCTHDSGGIVICKDKNKLDKNEIKNKINKSLKENYFYYGREWPYKNIKPRIIAEKYILDDTQSELKDYKFHCFNGKVKIILVCSNRFVDLEETFFDENWKLLNLKRPNHKVNQNISKPLNFEKMKSIAEELSKDIPFVRVDFYESEKKILFGELTFYPASGFSEFEPPEWDKVLGDMLVLPIQN